MLSQTTNNISTTPVIVCTAKAGRSINVETLSVTNTLPTEVVVDFFDGLVPGTILATIPVPGGGGAGLEDTGTAGARKPCSDIRTTPGNALYAACRTVGSCIANMRFGRL